MAIGTALLATQVGLGALQGIAGLVGAAKNKAPKYTMPAEYGQNLAEAQNRAAGGLPAASKQLATEQMARGTAAGLSKLQDRNSVATGVAALAQGEADQANRLAAMDAEARLRGEREVANARMAIANAKDKQFMINQQDYLRRAQANANLLGGGIQNIVGGLQNFGMMDIMKKYYGAGSAATSAANTVNSVADTATSATTPNIFPMFNYKNPMGMLNMNSGFTNEIGGINF